MDTNTDRDQRRAAYIEWLRGEVREYCNEDGLYEHYWSYDDRVDEEQLMRAVGEYDEDGYSSPVVMLDDMVRDNVASCDENYLGERIISDLARASANVRGYYAEHGALWDDLYEAGYEGVDMRIEEGLDHMGELRVNLMLSTPDEELGDIMHCYGAEPDGCATDARYADNALSYLVSQQGHGIDALLACRESGQETGDGLIDSISDELDETSYLSSQLTALVSMSARDFLRMGEALEKGQGSVMVPTGALVGLFDRFGGSGGALGIELAKPAVFPVGMLDAVQVEGAGEHNPGYTVDEVYGLVGSCWDADLEVNETHGAEAETAAYRLALESVTSQGEEVRGGASGIPEVRESRGAAERRDEER
ncbi:MAG: hypothetical protein Q4B30_06900 [Coriobacteriaceae bacterium]|nr:hypothetical protein [Coriobacteriaceae bacterium]